MDMLRSVLARRVPAHVWTGWDSKGHDETGIWTFVRKSLGSRKGAMGHVSGYISRSVYCLECCLKMSGQDKTVRRERENVEWD